MQIKLTVTTGPHSGREFVFDGHDNFIVGRAKTAQFRLSVKDQYFSRNHFLIEANPPLCRLLDLNSTNGTFVNGKQITSIELHDGDTIEAGDTTIQVCLVSESAPALQSAAGPQVVSEQTVMPRDWRRGPLAFAPTVSAQLIANEEVSATLVPRARHVALSPQPARCPSGNTVTDDERAKIATQHQPIPGYRIIEELGRGGMGIVYRARSEIDNALVAIKLILPAVATSAEDLARFVREADILKDLSHPHIVPFRDLGHANGQLYFVMDLVPGINGQEIVRCHDGPLPVARSIGIVSQLLEALAVAHRCGYVHRDVKPSNLLIESRGSSDFVWLADFGLARAYHASKLSGLTTTGNIGGTLPFMAPEQITNFRDVSPAADQYSAAATLYYLVTRRYPYDFPKEVAQQLLLILQEPPLPIQQHRPDLSDALAAVIHKALSRLPEERFAHVDLFRAALTSCGC